MRTGAMQGSWNSGNGAATVDIRKRLRAVRDPGPNPARSRDDLTSITGVFFDLLAGIHGRPLGRSPNGCASHQAAQGQSLRRLTALTDTIPIEKCGNYSVYAYPQSVW